MILLISGGQEQLLLKHNNLSTNLISHRLPFVTDLSPFSIIFQYRAAFI
jgi:hypothetical protein